MARGVRAGANRPSQALTSKLGRPESATVGSSGKLVLRRAVLTARPLMRPPRTCGPALGATSIIMSTRPPIRSVIAAAPPV